MYIRKPDYYDRFRCAAGACPDTCCAAWDIVIDPDSAAFYRALPGPLGERVRAAMTVDEEGAPCFSVSGGGCPLLTEGRLCTIQLKLGEERVCDTCRSHPRFVEEYGFLRELALAASCPAAVKLILDAPAAFTEEETEEPAFHCEDVDESLLRALLPFRQAALALAARPDLPWPLRLTGLLMLGAEGQLALDQDGPESLPPLAEEWTSVTAEELTTLPPPPEELRETRRRSLTLLSQLEILDPDWAEELCGALETLDQTPGGWDLIPDRPAELEPLEERWTAYLLYRWTLRADFDGDLYGKLALPGMSLLALRELLLARRLRGMPWGREEWTELARRWAKEIEHCGENLAALWTAACMDPMLSPHRLAAAYTKDDRERAERTLT